MIHGRPQTQTGSIAARTDLGPGSCGNDYGRSGRIEFESATGKPIIRMFVLEEDNLTERLVSELKPGAQFTRATVPVTAPSR